MRNYNTITANHPYWQIFADVGDPVAAAILMSCKAHELKVELTDEEKMYRHNEAEAQARRKAGQAYLDKDFQSSKVAHDNRTGTPGAQQGAPLGMSEGGDRGHVDNTGAPHVGDNTGAPHVGDNTGAPHVGDNTGAPHVGDNKPLGMSDADRRSHDKKEDADKEWAEKVARDKAAAAK